MKKVWALIIGVDSVIRQVHAKYHKNYVENCIFEAKNLSACRIKGVFKLTMRRFYA